MEQKLTILEDVTKYTKEDVLEEIKECVKLLTAIGFNGAVANHYVVQLSSASAKRLGNCKRIGINKFRILINSNFIKYGSAKDVHQCIMHEVIHSLPNCMNHKAPWQKVANAVNKNYIYNPITRVTKATEYQENFLNKQYKHKIICNACGKNWKWIRKSTRIEACLNHNAMCSCGSTDFSYIHIGD